MLTTGLFAKQGRCSVRFGLITIFEGTPSEATAYNYLIKGMRAPLTIG